MLGIIVDRVFDTEEIVVKPVAPILRHVTMFSGNTILGDGSVIMILDPNGIARATGDRRRPAKPAAARHDCRRDHRLRRAGPRCCCSAPGRSKQMAVPLGLVARLEDIPREKIELSCGAPVTQYRGKLMPLIAVDRQRSTSRSRTQPVLVFTDGDRTMGLMVDEIIDVVEDRLDIELSGARPGLLGTGGHRRPATDVLDTGYWLTQAWQDWFRGVPRAGDAQAGQQPRPGGRGQRLLPPVAGARSLGAAGYRVTAAASAAEALRLRDAGVMFDAIVSDIEMPDMDGLEFARAVRAGGPWADLPMIALTGHAEQRRRRSRPRGRLHRLRRQVRARGAGRSACAQPMPRAERRGSRHEPLRSRLSRNNRSHAMSHRRPGAARYRRHRRGQQVFVTLTVADQLCGVPVLAVRDILGEQTITRIPLAPPEIAGSLNLRGRIVTAIDLRRRLQLPPPPAGQRRMSVVAEQGGELYALLVDQVSEVLSLKRQRVRAQPADAGADLGRFQHRHLSAWTDRLLVVLDVARLLALSDAG